MILQLYSALMRLAQPYLLRKLKRRGALEPGYLVSMEERLGVYAAELPQDGKKLIWIHAVSLGETRAAEVLLKALRMQWPAMRLLLTHGTATGWAAGTPLLQPGDVQTWQPWDSAIAVTRFLQHFKPTVGILLETEIWPNLAAHCREMDIPLVLANARLSEKSLHKATRLAWLSRPAYMALTAVWAQTEADAQRLKSLGAPVWGVFGNLKFDAAPSPSQCATGRRLRQTLDRPVVMLASSREGEELQLLKLLRPLLPGIRWLIVPRHPQRFNEVAEMIQSMGFSLSRRSSWTELEKLPAQAADSEVWLGDSLGEMAFYFALADAALLGGSFEPLGGQNLIEAAACACPVIMGPHTFNFAQAAELALQEGAAFRVNNLNMGMQFAVQLAQDEKRKADMAKKAELFSQKHTGATRKTVAAIRDLLLQKGVDAI